MFQSPVTGRRAERRGLLKGHTGEARYGKRAVVRKEVAKEWKVGLPGGKR